MEKLSTRSTKKALTFFLCFAGILGYGAASATKVARISINELMGLADTVAVVAVFESKLTDRHQDQVHTAVKKSILKYQTNVVTKLKGNISGNEIRFTSTESLLVGEKYLVFLLNQGKGDLLVLNGRYGAFHITAVSFKAGILEGIRVPNSFVSIPPSLTVEPGVTAKNEQSSYVWATTAELISYLKLVK